MYLFGCIQLFFVTELFKSMQLREQDVDRYMDCVYVLNQTFTYLDDAKVACGALHYHDQYDHIVANLFCMVGVISFLVGDMRVDARYWVVCTSTMMIYIFLQTMTFFQFSLDSYSVHTLTVERVVLLSVVACTLLGIIARQLILKKVYYSSLFVPCFMYLLAWGLCVCSNVPYHFHVHHVIVAGLLSLILSQTWYLHAACIGIVIQGINYYGGSTLLLFQPSVEAPTTSFLLFVNFVYFCFLVVYITIRNRQHG